MVPSLIIYFHFETVAKERPENGNDWIPSITKVETFFRVGAIVNQKLFRRFATTTAVREGHLDILEILLKARASQPVCEEALLEASRLGSWGYECEQMDRTSILGDTIDYMKELLERIKNLQEEMDVNSDELNLMEIFKELKTNEIMIRNTPKVEDWIHVYYLLLFGKGSHRVASINVFKVYGTGVVLCIEKALARSSVSREDVNYINTHATSTQAGDIKEYKALIRCFAKGLECAGVSEKRKAGHKGFRIDVHALKPDFN
ncbi:hypothetical protein Syun_025601 [Stephania yunnanensis]|uniref:beta-ketoacyl-[acyl-carrier-protein] synthase I n=1 Tax=Stephania yunnanensis TaxID=152371 RepID=A0AAP0ERZ0_9MAGN